MASTLRPGGTVFTFTPYIPQQGPGTTIKFRALINSITESDSPSWEEHNDIGRADPKFLYSQYSKTISVNFRTAALYSNEIKIWMEALNSLSELTKPVYKPGLGYNGVFTKMVIGNMYDVVGFVTQLDKTLVDDTPWIDDVPIYIDVTISLRVIGNKKPDYKKSDKAFPKFNYGQGLSS